MTRRDFLARLARAAGLSAAWTHGGYEAAETALWKMADPSGSLLQRLAHWLFTRW